MSIIDSSLDECTCKYVWVKRKCGSFIENLSKGNIVEQLDMLDSCLLHFSSILQHGVSPLFKRDINIQRPSQSNFTSSKWFNANYP